MMPEGEDGIDFVIPTAATTQNQQGEFATILLVQVKNYTKNSISETPKRLFSLRSSTSVDVPRWYLRSKKNQCRLLSLYKSAKVEYT